jgi:hypothetical protein
VSAVAGADAHLDGLDAEVTLSNCGAWPEELLGNHLDREFSLDLGH